MQMYEIVFSLPDGTILHRSFVSAYDILDGIKVASEDFYRSADRLPYPEMSVGAHLSTVVAAGTPS